MTDLVFSRRLQQLIDQLKNHPFKEEIIKLAQEQLIDDSDVVEYCMVTND
jgi:hypothetical protein